MVPGFVIPQGAPALRSPLMGPVFLSVLAAILLLLSVLVVIWVQRWQRQIPPPLCTPEEELAEFERLRDLGELSPQEFDRIKERLQSRPKPTPPFPEN